MKIRTKLILYYCGATVLLMILIFFLLEAALFPKEGYDMLRLLNSKLVLIWIMSFVFLFLISSLVANSVLHPISKIIQDVEHITVLNLNQKIVSYSPKDEIGELAATFNRMLERIQDAVEAQKMFVSNVSHELLTPMSAMIAELELALHEEQTQNEYKTVLRNTLSDARKMAKLSGGLLDLAKASYHSQHIAMSPIRLDEVLLDAQMKITKANPHYKVNLIFNTEDDDDKMVTIIGNEYLLRTAFINLMDNNCKFSPDRRSTVQISFTKEKTVIKLEDSGIGIAKEEITKIFQPFYRGKNKHYTQGNGIGMALVEKIITLHQGEIFIISEENHGTLFTLFFNHI